MLARYARDGCVIVRRLFPRADMDGLRQVIRDDPRVQRDVLNVPDREGLPVRFHLRHVLAGDALSAVARSGRVVRRVEQLLGSHASHFHHKVILKEAREGGAWEWHQDYGYWYALNGFLLPALASCMIAVDDATTENGCLEVLRGSHAMGRIDHGSSGEQAGADAERVKVALGMFEKVPCELAAGDALFFHCNLLHASRANRSERPRVAVICSYSAVGNVLVGAPGLRGERVEALPDARVSDAIAAHARRAAFRKSAASA